MRRMLRMPLLLLVLLELVDCQLDVFALPSAQRYAAKPTVPPEYRSFFELDGHARELVDSLIGPRPGGFFPEKSFEVASPSFGSSSSSSSNAAAGPSNAVERTLEQFFSANPGQSQFRLPPGFNQGFSLQNGNSGTAFQHNKAPQTANVDEEVEGSGQEPRSSIQGIPKVFPNLPKAPISQGLPIPAVRPVLADRMPDLPKFASRPDVPEGGLGPAAPSSETRRHPVSVSSVAASSNSDSLPHVHDDQYGALTDEPTHTGGLIGTVLEMIGLNKKQDNSGLGKALGNLIGSKESPVPGKNMISNVLYKTLTSGTVQQTNASDTAMTNESRVVAATPLTLTAAQQASISENLAMIQNLITQPSSPLCNPKPDPVRSFDVDAFMGQWYQVLYSPPLSSGPCSMVAYKKLSDVNNGGAGTIFEMFEYATDGTPFAKPVISSGYAMVREPGELILRTTSNQEDVNAHVLALGPVKQGQYEYVVLSTNCNYPLYVFARDPVAYKSSYETMVNQLLDNKGLINGFSRLLNIVAAVDSSLCSFPPSLFNIQG